MMLCRWSGEWGLGTRYNKEGQSVAVCVPNSRGPFLANLGFERYPTGAFWAKQFPVTEGIEFYPQIFADGKLVTPVYWHRESQEPLVLCRMETHTLGAQSDREYERMVEEMRTLGWGWDLMDGGHKYIHVDDLEKIEGPPPEGAF